MMKKFIINTILFLLFVAGLVAILYRANFVLRHKEYAGVQDKFASMPEDSIEIVFIGSSHQFCSISPEILYDEYGIESFMLATSAQTVPMSYYAAMEAIELQNPRLIVFEVCYLTNDFRTVTDEMSHCFFDGMPECEAKYMGIKDLIEEEVLRIRKASVFETRYLRMKYKNGLSIIRVLDSHNEKFKLSEVYKRQVRVINVVTAPEIAMLVILAEGNYQDYKKTKKKPSEYCKENLKMKNVKSPEFIKEYFRDYKKLTAALCEYRRVTKPKANEYSAADLLKSNWDQHFIMGK